MSIKEILEKIKPFYQLFIVIAFSGLFFALGRISALEKEKTPIKIEYLGVSQTASVGNSDTIRATSPNSTKTSKTTVIVPKPVSGGEVIGSKSGKKYYFPWCGTVKRILPQNQVHFASAEEAKLAGFTPGGNCKGLK